VVKKSKAKTRSAAVRLKGRKARAVAVDMDKLMASRPRLREAYENALYEMEAARLIRNMRQEAGLNQAELAERLGVTQPRIARLERASPGRGASYAMVRRVAVVCDFDLPPPVPLAARD
jgi:DNA-binding XRE family transcriptional regulator